MSYAVEIVVSDHQSTAPEADASPAQRLPLMYDTVEATREAGVAFIAQNKAPRGTVTFQIVDEGGDLVVAPSDGSRP